jgi:membrane associated rhomboid family serine protease
VIPIRDTIPSRCAPVITWLLIAINVAVFFYELSLGPQGIERFFQHFGIIPAHVGEGGGFGFSLSVWWPFVTSMFVHGGWAHIIGNMWALWIFGDNVEDRMGPKRFLFFYFAAGIAAGLTHFFTNPHSTIPTVGASGAIAGVLGAYLFLFPRARIITIFPILFWPMFFELPAVTYLVFWFMTQLFGGLLASASPGEVGGIGWWAHVGGFAAGVLFHRVFIPPKASCPRAFERDEFGIEGAWGGWR